MTLRRVAGIDHGAHLRSRIKRIAGLRGRRAPHQPVHESILDAALHEQARIGGTDLALVEEDAEGRHVGRRIEIAAIGKDEIGALAAGFQPDLLHVRLTGILQEHLAHGGRTGEGEAIHIHMTAKRLASGFAKPGHHIEHASRQARFNSQFRQPQRRQRRLLGGFQHHRIARRQRRRALPGRHVEREIPRHHRADDAKRLAPHQHQITFAGGRHFVIDLVDGLAIPLEDRRRAGDVDRGCVLDQLAHVERFEQGKFMQVFAQQLRQPQQHLLAMGRAGP